MVNTVMALLKVVLLLCVGWCSSAPTRVKKSLHEDPQDFPPAPAPAPFPSPAPAPSPVPVPAPFPAPSPVPSPGPIPHIFPKPSVSPPIFPLPTIFPPPVTPSPPVFPAPHPGSTVSPYYADLEGRTAPVPPTLTDELTPPPVPCPDQEKHCDPQARYRTISGRCNNQEHPEYGTPGQAMHNLLPQIYDLPAVFRIRSARGGLLPNPRHISLILRHAPRNQEVSVNSLFVQMGQFIDHDIVTTTVARSRVPGTRLNCAPCSSWHNPACVPIPIPPHDPYKDYYLQGTERRRCLPFTRSVAYLAKDSQGRPTLHQANFNNAFLDMSPVYGNDACTAQKLRHSCCGKLQSSGNEMLVKKPASEFPFCRSDDGFCYFSGDIRANENVGLTVIHILFHRAHNQLAEGLVTVNPHWDNERLFQEARRINIAQFQNVIYGEYLPTLLGYHTAAKEQLIPHHEGYFLNYSTTIIPGVYDEFTTAAFRMGHSQVPPYISLMNEQYHLLYKVPLRYSFSNATLLSQNDVYDPLIRGLLGVSLKSTDLDLVDDLSNNLFQKKDVPLTGQDLFSVNIARGRDHGMAPYVQYLAACDIKEVSSFADLESLMPSETVAHLARAYDDVRDIDLFPGGLAERPLPGSLVGPTFNCIITRQFLNLKLGDRFWFENPSAGFSHDQLQSLRQVSLVRILCDAMDQHDPLIPTSAFLVPDQQSNPLRRCSSLPKLNLELWREPVLTPPPQCIYQGRTYQVGSVVPVSPCLNCVCQPCGLRCQCDLSGCTQTPQDEHCQRICSNPPLPYQL